MKNIQMVFQNENKHWFIFILICATSYFLIFISNLLLNTEELLYDKLIGNLDENRVKQIMEIYKKQRFLSYFVLPIILLVKFFAISSLLYIGIIFHANKTIFKSLFTIVMNSEFITIAGSFCVILYIWLTGGYSNYTESQSLPFSVLALFNSSEIEPWLIYPFSVLNIFEVFYWVALIVQWKKLTGKTYGESFDFIGSTYGLGLLLWVLVVVFFTI